MTTIEYDLDLTGGLMEEIHRLVAPPQIDDKSRRLRVKERIIYRRPGKLPNRDSCDSCKEGGDLLCCDRCPAAFHLQCHDPPLEEEDVPPGEWLCHCCLAKPLADDDDSGSTCSSKSRHSDTSHATLYKRLVSGGRRGRGAGEGEYPDLDFTDMTDDDRSNPLRMLAKATKILNPKQFELPKDVVCPINFPGSSKVGSLKRKPGRGDAGRGLTTKRNVIEVDKGIVPLPAKLCFVCGRSCRVAALMQCDYCPLVFHLDCLNPPLTALPYGRWMCPNHVEHVLDDMLLKSVRLTDRIKLWDKYTGPMDTHAIKLQFLDKVHRRNPMFRYKQVQPHRVTIKVPDAIKAMYASAKYSRNKTLFESTERLSNPASHELDTSINDLDTSADVAMETDQLDDTSLSKGEQSDEVVNSLPPVSCSKSVDVSSESASNKSVSTNVADGDIDMKSDTSQDCQSVANRDAVSNLLPHDEWSLKKEPASKQLNGKLFDTPSISDDLHNARALFCPVGSTQSSSGAVPMIYRTLHIGTGSDMDVCLTSFGHCNFASTKHACIFFDQLSGEYELLNYSEYGTMVGGVLYSCDLTTKSSSTKPKQASKIVTSVRQIVQSAPSRNTDNGLLERSDRLGTGTLTHPAVQTLAHLESFKPCRCKSDSDDLVSKNSAGWEGSAVVYHGCHIKIGCLEFVFSIIEQATVDENSIKTVHEYD